MIDRRAVLLGLAGLGLGLNFHRSKPRSLFATSDRLKRARDPAKRSSLSRFMMRVKEYQGYKPNVFSVVDPTIISYGWTNRNKRIYPSLHHAVAMLTEDSAVVRDLAIAFSITGDQKYSDLAGAIIEEWASNHTPVNFYDFEPDFSRGTHRGQTSGMTSFRPWNFGLDLIWQCYGLINMADAILLLRGGLPMSATADLMVKAWIDRLTSAVDSGFHAWARWADAHPESRAYERYRTDNHLSWAMTGLLAAAAASNNQELARYVLRGQMWDNGRGGPYRNPSSIPRVIVAAIEMDERYRGRLYEERIKRSPLIGYALFHLEAMKLSARIAELHFSNLLWNDERVATRLVAAAERYVPYIDGVKKSSDRRDHGRVYPWRFSLSPRHIGGDRRYYILKVGSIGEYIHHVIGPAGLYIE